MSDETKILVLCAENLIPGEFGSFEICEGCGKLIMLSERCRDRIVASHPEIVQGRTGNAAIFAVMQHCELACNECGIKRIELGKATDAKFVRVSDQPDKVEDIPEWIRNKKGKRDN